MVSVIIPVYNGEKYIEDAINSVLSQTYKQIEIIVIDDGSDDNTGKIVKSFSNVRYFRQTNQGVSASRNYGMSKAGGDYIAFLDADDVYRPDKIEKQVRILNKYPDADVVYNDGILADINLKTINILRSEYLVKRQEDFAALLLFRQIVPIPASIMITTRCFKEGFTYNEKYKQAEDYEYILRLALKYRFVYLPEPLYVYRRHESNLTNNHCSQQQREIDVLRRLGFETINKIITESSLSSFEKHLLLAKIYIKVNEYNLAKGLLLKLAKHNHGHPYLWFYLGNCSYFLKELKEAEEYYKKAIQSDGKMAEAYNNLACVYIEKDKLTAVEFLQHALKLRPNYMDAIYNMSQIERGQTSIKITKRELRKVLTNYINI